MERRNWIASAVGGPLLALSLASCGTLTRAALEATLNKVQSSASAGEAAAVRVAPAIERTPIPDEILGSAESDERLIAGIYQNSAPSVVHIRVVQHVDQALLPQIQIPQIPGFPNPDLSQPPQDSYRRGEGSGFVWDDQGHIVTNNHVVQNAQKIEVQFFDGRSVPAEVVGTDPDSDLAVLMVDLTGLKPLPIGNSDEVFVGEHALAIGNPFGQEWTLTTGIISGVGRTLPSGASQFSNPELIQTDAAINPGNSGGPLLNDNGEVIGVNAIIISGAQVSSGVGFAIPINTVKRVAPEIIRSGGYQYSWLGISGRTVDRETADAMELPQDTRGALVVTVTEGGPAEDAKLQPSNETITVDGLDIPVGGDVVVGIDAQPVTTMDDLVAYLVTETRPGDTVNLHILRGGKAIEVNITLGTRPQAE